MLMSRVLTPDELRVLGVLIEKEITTPDYYPLSLNALVNGCNQRSSRDPVVDLTQRSVLEALEGLEALDCTAAVHDGRVTKYEHRVRTTLQLRRDETAILCLLLLRGPQTPGELRSRADRLYAFDDLSSVVSTLDRLASRGAGAASETESEGSGPLTIMLPRQPGAREARYAHLLGSTPQEANMRQIGTDGVAIPDTSSLEVTVVRLSEAVNLMEARLARLEARLHVPTPPSESPDIE